MSVGLIVWVIQAVNFLDFVSEDGHNFKVYFFFTLLSLPKIISRILPFIFFLSLFYMLLKYENKSELIIFWTNGITKHNFIFNLIKYSLFYLLIQLVLTSYVVPTTQDSARSFLRNSNIDFFPNLIKEKKFIDTVSNLTIFIDKKDENGNFINIFLKDKLSGEKSQTIYAKTGKIVNNSSGNFLVLKDGKILNQYKKNMTILHFERTEFNLSKYTTKTTIYPKIQEIPTLLLIDCVKKLYLDKIINFRYEFLDCNKRLLAPVLKEIFKRIYLPIYIPIIAMFTGLLVLRSKSQENFNNYKVTIFSVTFLLIVISEISVKYIGLNNFINLIATMTPITIFILTYLLFCKTEKI